jgi:hypothetical protein
MTICAASHSHLILACSPQSSLEKEREINNSDASSSAPQKLNITQKLWRRNGAGEETIQAAMGHGRQLPVTFFFAKEAREAAQMQLPVTVIKEKSSTRHGGREQPGSL